MNNKPIQSLVSESIYNYKFYVLMSKSTRQIILTQKTEYDLMIDGKGFFYFIFISALSFLFDVFFFKWINFLSKFKRIYGQIKMCKCLSLHMIVACIWKSYHFFRETFKMAFNCNISLQSITSQAGRFIKAKKFHRLPRV